MSVRKEEGKGKNVDRDVVVLGEPISIEQLDLSGCTRRYYWGNIFASVPLGMAVSINKCYGTVSDALKRCLLSDDILYNHYSVVSKNVDGKRLVYIIRRGE